jgi:YggT family protein
MNSFVTQAGVYLVKVVFELYLFAVLLRFLFQLVRADFYNPVAQFVVALTNPVLRPLRRAIPGLFGIDLASVLLLFVIKSGEWFLIAWLRDIPAPFSAIAIAAVTELLELTLYVFIVAVFVRVLLSWVVPYGGHPSPVMGLLVSLTEPLMRPARRLIPSIGGVDLSPIAVIVVLQLGVMLVQYLSFRLS